MRIPFVGGAYSGRSKNLNAQVCRNLYVEMDQRDKAPVALIGSPGLSLFTTAGDGPIRGMREYNGLIYAVSGNTLYEINSAGTATSRGTIGTSTGPVSMSDNGPNNGTELMIVDGSSGWIYDSATSTLTEIADADFPTADVVTFMDGYFIVNVNNTGKFQYSALYDGTTWDALDFQTAEGSPDSLVSVFADHRELWLFGDKTTEVFYNTGDSDNPFARFQGGFTERGCAARFSVAKVDNSIFWLSKDERGDCLIVRAGEGYRTQVVSTPQINYQLDQYTTVSDAVAYTYQEEGHEFYVLTFPTANATWVYDASTGEWHQRSSQIGSVLVNRHRSNCHVFAFGKHYVGDYANGKIYHMDLETYDENGTAIIRDRITQHLSDNENRLFLREMVVNFEEGVGLTTGQGSDPQAMLRWSKNGGHTWSNELWRSFGAKGEYRRRAVWRNLGWGRDWTFWLRVSDPVKVVIVDAQAKVRGEP